MTLPQPPRGPGLQNHPAAPRTTSDPQIFDVVIVGAGPGLQDVATLLGDRGRRVAALDASLSPDIGGLLTGAGQASSLESVTFLAGAVHDVERTGSGFTAHCDHGATLAARALVLAADALDPDLQLPGAEAFYGVSLHQCPYCDGWAHRGKRLGVLGADDASVDLALRLLKWSSRVTLFANGDGVRAPNERRLEKSRIPVVAGTVTALLGSDGILQNLEIHAAPTQPCEALFFASPRKYHSSLAARLGCDMERIGGAVNWKTDGDADTAGVFVSNDLQQAAEAADSWLLEADRPPGGEPSFHPAGRKFWAAKGPRPLVTRVS